MICGVDEAGRGPVSGPLVVAGVNFENDLELIENNVCDSKKIKPEIREILSKRIKKIATNYEILIIYAVLRKSCGNKIIIMIYKYIIANK